ncbi:MAG: NAD(P)H-dependent flavin oxidoreductase [Candidatus Odinarchaeota archaeon]
MVITTEITEMLDIKHPIVAAPMGPFYTTKLTVAVSEAGGLGVLSHINLDNTVSLTEVKESMTYVVEHTDKSFGLNIRTASLQPDAVKLCRQVPRFIMNNPRIKEQCNYIITSAGSPKMLFNKYFEILKNSTNLKHFHVIPSLDLAKKVVKDGVDGIVATGHEGGGHKSYDNTSTLILLQQVRKELPDIPVIASGGYATGEGLASALAMGAGAISMGTRLIASNECEFHNNYKNVVKNSTISDTKLVTGVFGPARVWRNKYADNHTTVVNKAEKRAEETSMDVVVQGVKKLEKAYRGNVDDGIVLLGQSCGLVNNIERVSNIINTIVDDAEECLKNAYNMIKVNQVILENV